MFAVPFNYQDIITLVSQDAEEGVPNLGDSASIFLYLYASGRFVIESTDYLGSTTQLADTLWCTPGNYNFADNYEVFAAVTGDVSGSATGTWLPISSLGSEEFYSWGVTGSNPDDTIGDITLSIRRAGNATVLATSQHDFRVRP
jgi:hypothetical protein